MLWLSINFPPDGCVFRFECVLFAWIIAVRTHTLCNHPTWGQKSKHTPNSLHSKLMKSSWFQHNVNWIVILLVFPFVHIHSGFGFYSWKSLRTSTWKYLNHFWIVLPLSLRVRACACVCACTSICLSFYLSISVWASLHGIQWYIMYSVQKIKCTPSLSHSMFCCLFVYTFRAFFFVCENVFVRIFGKSLLQSKLSKEYWFKITLHFKMSFSSHHLLLPSEMDINAELHYSRHTHTLHLIGAFFLKLVRYFYLFGR